MNILANEMKLKPRCWANNGKTRKIDMGNWENGKTEPWGNWENGKTGKHGNTGN